MSAWVPTGAIDAMIGVVGRAVAQASGVRRERFPRHDEEAVSRIGAGYGATVAVHDGELGFVADSKVYFDAQERDHPMALASGTVPSVRGLTRLCIPRHSMRCAVARAPSPSV